MGSFQQVMMGATCLVAAFLFGSYLHNRPAANEQTDQSQVASANSLDSIFAFGKAKSDTQLSGPNSTQAKLPTMSAVPPSFDSRTDVEHIKPSVDKSELVPGSTFIVAASEDRSDSPAGSQEKMTGEMRKPVVPDFSELASRFRNTPLQLGEEKNTESMNSAIDKSELVRGFDTFNEAPKVVIRKPQKLTPLQDFANQVDRVEQSRGSQVNRDDVATEQSQHRWRVNRSQDIDRFRDRGTLPQPDIEPRQPRRTIDDIVAEDSVNYLLKSDAETSTFATEPVKRTNDDWASTRRQQITQKAANRGRDILDIDDPGSRFHSVLSSSGATDSSQSSFGPPEPDYEADYYTPVKPQPVTIQPQQMRRIERQSSNWQSRSSVQTETRNDTYRIQPGDTLQSISVRFYGVPDHYLDLYKANRSVLDRITSSPQGVDIVIPKLNN